jgi:hypothetical protein
MGAVFAAKFMLPWSFSEEGAAERCMRQVQRNMWVVHAKSAVLSVITGGGKWVEITANADPLQALKVGRRELRSPQRRRLATHRSSPSIASMAAALAKASTKLECRCPGLTFPQRRH